MTGRKRGHQSPADADYDVPFFTVAHYKSPTATPTTYEFAAPHIPIPNYTKSQHRDPQNTASIYIPATSPKVIQSYASATSPMGIQGYAPGTSPKVVQGCAPGTSLKGVTPLNFSPSTGNINTHKTSNSFQDERIDSSMQGFCGGAGEALCNDSLDTNISPVSLAFGPSLPGESWWPPDDIISPSDTSPNNQYHIQQQNFRSYEDIRRSRTRERTPVDTIPETPFQEHDSFYSSESSDEILVKQPVNFTISPPTRPKSRKRTPESPGQQRSNPATPNGSIGGNTNLSRAIKVYEDASVSDAGEQLFPSPPQRILIHDNVEKESTTVPNLSLTIGSIVKDISNFKGHLESDHEIGYIQDKSRSTESLLDNSGFSQDLVKSDQVISSNPDGDRLSRKFNSNVEELVKDLDRKNKSIVQRSQSLEHRIESSQLDLSRKQKDMNQNHTSNKTKPQVPPKPTQQQIESASRRNSAVDTSLDSNRLSLSVKEIAQFDTLSYKSTETEISKEKVTASLLTAEGSAQSEKNQVNDIKNYDHIPSISDSRVPSKVKSPEIQLSLQPNVMAHVSDITAGSIAANSNSKNQPHLQLPSNTKSTPSNPNYVVESSPARVNSISHSHVVQSRESTSHVDKSLSSKNQMKPTLDNSETTDRTVYRVDTGGCAAEPAAPGNNDAFNSNKMASASAQITSSNRSAGSSEVPPRTPRTPRSKSRFYFAQRVFVLFE